MVRGVRTSKGNCPVNLSLYAESFTQSCKESKGAKMFSFAPLLPLVDWVRHYSILKLFIGLDTAAFTDCTLTVISAIKITSNPAAANIHHDSSIRYAKLSNH